MYDDKKYQAFHEDMKRYNFVTPVLAYKDDFYLNMILDMPYEKYVPEKDILFLNANNSNGKNMFEAFCNKYFLKGIMDNKAVRARFYPLIKMYLRDDGKRGIAFDYFETFVHLLADVDILEDLEGKNQMDGILYTKNILIEKRNKLNDVLVNKQNSIYYSEVAESLGGEGNPVNDFTVGKYIEYYNALIMTANHIRMNVRDGLDINTDEFVSCFDLDKLYLIICKAIMDVIRPIVEEYKAVTPAYAQVKMYVDMALDVLGEDYNPKIKYYDFNTKSIKKYSFKDLLYEARQFEKEIDLSQFQKIDLEDAMKMELDKIENVNKLNELYRSTPEGDFITDWDIIRPGEKDPSLGDEVHRTHRNLEGQPTEKKVLENSDIMYRRFTFEKTNYSGKIVGREKFAGYIGYIYPNGLVAFEKFYEDEKFTPVKAGNATYIMTIDNFAKFTHLDKQQIIEYIKQTDNPGVQRIYHSKNWENKLISAINSVSYTDEIKAIIDSILEKYQVKKKEV